MNAHQTHIQLASENSYIIYFGDPDALDISPHVSATIAITCAQIKQHFGNRLIDLVASYASLLVIYDTDKCDHLWSKKALRSILEAPQAAHQDSGHLVNMPVFYSTTYGPELDLIAQSSGLSVNQVIDIHSASEYRVYAIGFAPGFAYLGELDERLAAPRLATPRLKVPAGAVAIADRQTAVYPASSPGGWNLIGLCPTPMFNPEKAPHMPVSVGDRVKFNPINEQQYLAMGANCMSFKVLQPGLLSLLQDLGRFGQHAIGLTTGGPLDREAFLWANRILHNPSNACAIEISFGGLQLQAQIDSYFCVTGASLEVTVNGINKALWTSHKVKAGDEIKLGYSSHGCRSYLGVAGGFHITPSFGSQATVMREKIGGLNGAKLKAQDSLACNQTVQLRRQALAVKDWPLYGPQGPETNIPNRVLRLLPGYQHHHFDAATRARFFHSQFRVTDRSDRMGMRLEGPAVPCPSQQMLSEGICLGAVQVPADGQPIVLLNDRQTIGGYPKIGAIMARDLAQLVQLRPGDAVTFEAVDLYQAQTINTLAQLKFEATKLLHLKE